MVSGRYSREREIGRGGMGAVWLGRDEVLGRRVAIKRVGLMPGAAGPDLQRAEREARIAASLNHPHIIGVLDLVEDAEGQWLVMEYVDGSTLADLIRTRGPLPADFVTPILAQVASALAAAHAHQIVHRDVKPSNILVREDGHVKLTDFGIARGLTDPSLTQTGLVTGSPAYLAPEVATGSGATPASDVWSLGATLFHALAGRAPYEAGDTVLGALYRIVNEPPPRLPDAGALAPVLEATLTHDPQARWSMAEVARVLAEVDPSAPSPLPSPGPAADPATRTRVLPAPPAPAGAAVPSPPIGRAATVAAGTPAPPSTASRPGARRAVPAPPAPGRRRSRTGVVLGSVVLGLVLLIAVLLALDDPQRTTGGQPDAAAPSASSSAGEEPTGSPTDTGSPDPDAPAVAQLEAFIGAYLATASSDPAAGFALLTPQFQAQSPRYGEFWSRVTNPRVVSFDADVDRLVVTYRYRYNLRGEGVQTETVTLQLVREGDTFLIAGEA
ncbi:serine/threonine-protein kinase [Nocardioides sp.]|uniref:serine/threonine-protein kinase n=1 Tax=Nocardioides sp. TaxID=35761 RepID=UPI003515262C